MSRKKSGRDEPAKKPEPTFKNSGLAQALEGWKQAKPTPAPPAPAKSTKAPPPPPPKPAPADRDVLAEDEIFLRAIGEIERLPDAPPVESPLAATVRREDRQSDAEALARLAELVADGEGLIFVNGGAIARGASVGLLDPLRRGEFPVQARIEMPGLTHEALEQFLTHCRRQGLRCVTATVSADTLKDWMGRGKLSRMVLGYASEPTTTSFLLRR